MPILIGLDVGTSGLKAIAIEGETGALCASASRDYPLSTPRPQWAEQDGRDFAEAALSALQELRTTLASRANDVRAIGLTGQMHSAILLDEHGELVRPAILWCDTRTSAECAEIRETLGLEGLRRTVKNLALEGFTLPKLLWLRRHEPSAFARVRRVLMPKDWVGAQLTGVIATDVSDASGTLVFDPEARTWSSEVMQAFGLDPSLFPTADESPTTLGGLSRLAAERTGFREGLPVARGAADNAAGAVGLGVVRPGRAMCSIGTSGVVLAHTESLRVDDQMRLHSFCAAVPGESYLMGVMLAAGGALRWFRDTFSVPSYEHISQAAARAPIGSRGIVFLPYLMGERTPHNDAFARGALVGLTTSAGFDDIARSVLEGITFGLCDSLDLMRVANPDVTLDSVRVTGGGARSDFWRQLIADVFQAQVLVTNSHEGPAFGAALLAGVSTGVFDSVVQAADTTVRLVVCVEPGQAAYGSARAQYRGVYEELKQRFREMGG